MEKIQLTFSIYVGRENKQKILIQEIGGNAIPFTVYDKVKKKNKGGQASHELQTSALKHFGYYK